MNLWGCLVVLAIGFTAGEGHDRTAIGLAVMLAITLTFSWFAGRSPHEAIKRHLDRALLRPHEDQAE